ncbi:MAG: MFS transporter, partial [Pseudomonadota bacterium]|nr:MFS transporter [Pseudomonadota bacterium]
MQNARSMTLGFGALADLRVLLMLGLGYSSGLPFLLVFGTLSAWLRESGIPVTEIGLLSYVALAYTLKFLWAPVIDAVDVPLLARLLGRRRAWMILSQLVIALGLAAMALTNPAANLLLTVVCAFVVAFASATQDVAIDGWRIDAAPTSRQGVLAATYQLGYRLGLISAGAGALYLADLAAWSTAYTTMAALMAVGILASLCAPMAEGREDAAAPHSPAASPPRPYGIAQALIEPIADLVRRKGAALIPILLLVSLYRMPDFVAGIMANPLYIDLGFTKSDIASVSKLYGVVVGIVGAFVGGLAIVRLGLRASLLIGAVAGAGSNLLFSWLALQGAKLDLLILCISLDNFAGGFAGSALIAFMSALTGKGYTATQYALLSSLYALPGKLVGGISGFIVAGYGYPTFFALTAAFG